MTKFIHVWFLVLLPLFAHAIDKPRMPATKNTAVVFIHGTSDHRQDADGIYWKKEYVKKITANLPNPDNYLIVHCDFRQYMWKPESSGCIAEQVTQFINDRGIDDIIVLTHSMGGLVFRWLLSNPSYDPRFPQIIEKVRYVNAVAPPNAGSPLADAVLRGTVFSKSVGWLLGYKTDAIRQLRVSEMAVYNQESLLGTQGRPSLPVPYYSIIGTDVYASPFSSDNYCNGYRTNIGLKFTKWYLDSCADGFINCSSQAAAGEVWFYDKDMTSGHKILNHNQSRHDCFGLGDIMSRDIS